MHLSRLFGHTLREAPSEAETASHRLLLRAGCIDQLMAGVYTYLPLGYRVKRKVEQIVREEMDRADAQEVHMPAIQPIDIWERSGRLDGFGGILFRLQDQRDRPLVLAPTHEEVITQLFADHANSYRDMPVTLYQIQTKFRDEARPRGGLVRVREFTMKDAYSFDIDESGLDASYAAMFEAYHRIFARCGVPTVPVHADSGAIGGKGSQEFIFPTDTGEDVIVQCDRCGYAANTEKAVFVRPPATTEAPLPTEVVETPGTTSIESLAALLGVPEAKTAKAVFYLATDPHRSDDAGEAIFAVVRGDLQVNEVKLRNLLGGRELRPLTDTEITAIGAVAGYASPIGITPGRARVVADESIIVSPNLVAGANQPGRHLLHTNHGRDWQANEVADIALAQAGHTCGECQQGTLRAMRGIEMGHVFRLGRLYSEKFAVTVPDADGDRITPIMGCYGIGVDRILAAAVEEHHDEAGIVWPASIAPYDVHLITIGADRDPAIGAEAATLYAALEATGLTVLYDDRAESPGVKFNDADLIGLPLRVTVSPRNQKAGVVEVQQRIAGARLKASAVPTADVVADLRERHTALIAALNHTS